MFGSRCMEHLFLLICPLTLSLDYDAKVHVRELWSKRGCQIVCFYLAIHCLALTHRLRVFKQNVREGIQRHDGLGKAFEEDPLLSGFGQSELDVVLAIAISNQQAKGYTVGEVGAGNGSFTKKVSRASHQRGRFA